MDKNGSSIVIDQSFVALSFTEEANAQGTIGTQINEANNINLTPRFDDDFCLNRADRANFNGSVSSVNYCYAADILCPEDVYQATVGFYRPVIDIDGDEVFQLVRSFTININNTQVQSRTTFRCDAINIVPPIAVQIGDAIGVCSRNFNPPQSNQLRRLVFNAETDNEDDRLRCNNICGPGAGVLPSIVESDGLDTELNNRNMRILLINADIGRFRHIRLLSENSHIGTCWTCFFVLCRKMLLFHYIYCFIGLTLYNKLRGISTIGSLCRTASHTALTIKNNLSLPQTAEIDPPDLTTEPNTATTQPNTATTQLSTATTQLSTATTGPNNLLGDEEENQITIIIVVSTAVSATLVIMCLIAALTLVVTINRKREGRSQKRNNVEQSQSLVAMDHSKFSSLAHYQTHIISMVATTSKSSSQVIHLHL